MIILIGSTSSTDDSREKRREDKLVSAPLARSAINVFRISLQKRPWQFSKNCRPIPTYIVGSSYKECNICILYRIFGNVILMIHARLTLSLSLSLWDERSTHRRFRDPPIHHLQSHLRSKLQVRADEGKHSCYMEREGREQKSRCMVINCSGRPSCLNRKLRESSRTTSGYSKRTDCTRKIPTKNPTREPQVWVLWILDQTPWHPMGYAKGRCDYVHS